MTALQVLMSYGPLEARHIAQHLGVPIEAVYAELVPLESRGLVRINVRFVGREDVAREWECMTS